jgi:hypothetical protein
MYIILNPIKILKEITTTSNVDCNEKSLHHFALYANDPLQMENVVQSQVFEPRLNNSLRGLAINVLSIRLIYALLNYIKLADFPRCSRLRVT